MAHRSRPRQAHATRRSFERRRIRRAVLTRRAEQYYPPRTTSLPCLPSYIALQLKCGSKSWSFFTTAHALWNNVRAAAHRATFAGLPAARSR